MSDNMKVIDRPSTSDAVVWKNLVKKYGDRGTLGMIQTGYHDGIPASTLANIFHWVFVAKALGLSKGVIYADGTRERSWD
jgi:hypothetical protein